MKRTLISILIALPIICYTQTSTRVPPNSSYNSAPHNYDAGAGTEGSPWTNADNTADIQTAITALATRGGNISLKAGRYNVSSAITLTQPSLVIAGDAAGFGPTNAETESLTGTKLLRGTTGNIFQIGTASSGSRPGGIILHDLYLWGSSAAPGSTPFASNAAIDFSGYTDQTILTRVRVSNFGTAIHLTTNARWTDAATVNLASIHGNGYGIVLSSGGTSWYDSITQNQISDNDYHAIYAEASGDVVDNNLIRGNTIVRNCRVSGCSSNPSNVYWSRNHSIIEGNQIQDAGVCLAGSPNCPGPGASRLADELVLAGSSNTVTANYFGRKVSFTGASCINITGNSNKIQDNVFENCDTDITVQAGASDNIIDQPGANIADAGTRTVINGVGSNAGDPNSTGNWNGHSKWAGLIINDTSNGVQYLYLSPSTRIQVGQGTGSAAAAAPYLTIGGVNYVASTMHPATKPNASPTWVNSVAPTATAGANGDLVLTGTGNYWQVGGATTSVECEFQFSSAGQVGASHYPGAGVYLYDSTNSRIWWFHAFVFTNTSTPAAGMEDVIGVQLAMETWTYNGSGNPSFSGSTNKHFPYFGGGPIHLKLSAAAGTATAAVSFNGGVTFTTWDTESVGTIGGGGYSMHGDTSTTGLMDVYSIIVN